MEIRQCFHLSTNRVAFSHPNPSTQNGPTIFVVVEMLFRVLRLQLYQSFFV